MISSLKNKDTLQVTLDPKKFEKQKLLSIAENQDDIQTIMELENNLHAKKSIKLMRVDLQRHENKSLRISGIRPHFL